MNAPTVELFSNFLFQHFGFFLMHFGFSLLILKANLYRFAGLLLFILETAPKIQNNSKFAKEQEMLANWTTDLAKRPLKKTDKLGINGLIS